ncbi:hypothetical protein GCM10023328_46520 [Modestobacter marinus]|uniref:Two-component sensor histidine kinase n=1 Tax=Modestobacter marinus TaxID=477641 RepID=A0A846LVC2_9ACTN|nr:ATP-binding protein [Modestobacter marinus]NIH70322.1 two-component sensor histidine kinase [Modestobacter marinus]NIH70343.1 two-component sensor histidine kinase [Modestobacter marinus]GGL83659.1 hypothetical protein GCM10011589_45090 [Modestobacter marinus]
MSDPTGTPTGYADAFTSWHANRPTPQATDTRLALELGSLRGLSMVRRQVRDFLLSSLDVGRDDDASPTVEDAVEKAILVIDELTSNAVRHGALPASLRIADEDGHWLIIVTDAAPDRLPAPARERPAGGGGYGLYVIADLTATHGVHCEHDRKHVCACLSKPT